MANLSNINNKFLVTTGGNVGINSTGPLALLSVGSGSLTDSNLPIQISTSGGTSQVWYGVNKNGGYGLLLGYHEGGLGGGGSGAYIRNVTEDPLYFMVSNTDLAMTILANKNVGIGVNYTNAKLSVNGNLAILNTKQINLTGTLDSDKLWYGMRYDNNEVQIYTYYPSDRSTS